MIALALLTAIIAEAASSSSRARAHELANRLGVKPGRDRLSGLAGRIEWGRTHLPRAQTPEQTAQLRKETTDSVIDLIRAMGLDPNTQEATPVDYAVPWLFRQVWRMHAEPDFGWPRISSDRMEALREWLSASRRELTQITYFDAMPVAQTWWQHEKNERLEKQLMDEYLEESRNDESRINLSDGWFAVEINAEDAVYFEGVMMSNCLAEGDYDHVPGTEEQMLFSLRSPENKPVATIHLQERVINYQDKGRGWAWVPAEARLRFNAAPTEEPYRSKVIELVDMFAPDRRTWSHTVMSILTASELQDLVEVQASAGREDRLSFLAIEIDAAVRGKFPDMLPYSWIAGGDDDGVVAQADFITAPGKASHYHAAVRLRLNYPGQRFNFAEPVVITIEAVKRGGVTSLRRIPVGDSHTVQVHIDDFHGVKDALQALHDRLAQHKIIDPKEEVQFKLPEGTTREHAEEVAEAAAEWLAADLRRRTAS